MVLEQIIGCLDAVDKSVTLALNFDGGRMADSFFYNISNSLSWIPLALLFFYFIYKDYKGDWVQSCLILFGLVMTITLCDSTSSGIIKPLVMRPRPSHDLQICRLFHMVNGYRGGHYGIVVSYSRIYLGVHYFGDVICGAMLGILIGLTVYACAMKLKHIHSRMPITSVH